jgi:hypothetical protein
MIASLGAALVRVRHFAEDNGNAPSGNAAKKTKHMQMVSRVINLPLQAAKAVDAGITLRLLSNIASSEERLQKTRAVANKRRLREEASGASCSTFVRIPAFAK